MWRKGLLCHTGVTRECGAIVPSTALQLWDQVSLEGFLGVFLGDTKKEKQVTRENLAWELGRRDVGVFALEGVWESPG